MSNSGMSLKSQASRHRYGNCFGNALFAPYSFALAHSILVRLAHHGGPEPSVLLAWLPVPPCPPGLQNTHVPNNGCCMPNPLGRGRVRKWMSKATASTTSTATATRNMKQWSSWSIAVYPISGGLQAICNSCSAPSSGRRSACPRTTSVQPGCHAVLAVQRSAHRGQGRSCRPVCRP